MKLFALAMLLTIGLSLSPVRADDHGPWDEPVCDGYDGDPGNCWETV